MVSILFILLFLIGLGYSIISGDTKGMNEALTIAPKEAILVYFETAYTLIFWSGLLQVALDSGMLKFISRLFVFIIHPFFHKIKKDDIALNYIALNLLSNMFSVGSAATPFGLKAFERLDELNEHSEVISDEMITFLNLNSSCVCFLPISLISTRMCYGGEKQGIIILGVSIIGIVLMIFSLLLGRVMRYFKV